MVTKAMMMPATWAPNCIICGSILIMRPAFGGVSLLSSAMVDADPNDNQGCARMAANHICDGRV
jgi:hypothetical protein